MRCLALMALVALPSTAIAADKSADRATRAFISAVKRGIDPVAAGIVPQLTRLQSAQLQSVRRCRTRNLARGGRKLVIWECGYGPGMRAYLTELIFDGDAVTKVTIEQLEMRPSGSRR